MIDVKSPYDQLYLTDKPIILVTGGRGSGKTFNVSLWAKRLTYEANHVVLYCRYTKESVKDSIYPEFLEKIKLEGDNNIITNKYNALNLLSGSEVIFSGIKASSGNQTAKLKGIQGLTTFIVDEGEEWQSEDDYDTIRLSIRTKKAKNRVVILMNPSDSEHFIYKKYIEHSHKMIDIDGVAVQVSTHPDVFHIHTTYLDNIENLSKTFLQEIESIKESNPSKYAHKVIGAWSTKAEGVIFDNWEEGEFDESLPYCYGQDYGFSIDPTTLIKVAVDKRAKKIYVKECFYDDSGLSTSEIERLNKMHIDKPNDLIVADSAEMRLISELNQKGLNIIPCEKGAGSVRAGILALLDFKIIAHPGSYNLIKELNNHTWNDKKSGIPNDSFNHCIDPLRYSFRKLNNPINTLYL